MVTKVEKIEKLPLAISKRLDSVTLVRLSLLNRKLRSIIASDEADWTKRLGEDCPGSTGDVDWLEWYRKVGAYNVEPTREDLKDGGGDESDESDENDENDENDEGTNYETIDRHGESETQTKKLTPPSALRTYCAYQQLRENWKKGTNKKRSIKLHQLPKDKAHCWRVLFASVWGAIIDNGDDEIYFIGNKPEASLERLEATKQFRHPTKATMSSRYVAISVERGPAPERKNAIWVWKMGEFSKGHLCPLPLVDLEISELYGDRLLVSSETKTGCWVVHLERLGWLPVIDFENYETCHTRKETDDKSQIFLARLNTAPASGTASAPNTTLRLNWRTALIGPFFEHIVDTSREQALTVAVTSGKSRLWSKKLDEDRVLLLVGPQLGVSNWVGFLSLGTRTLTQQIDFGNHPRSVFPTSEQLICLSKTEWQVRNIQNGNILDRFRCADNLQPIQVVLDQFIVVKFHPKGVMTMDATKGCMCGMTCQLEASWDACDVSATALLVLRSSEAPYLDVYSFS